MQAILQNHSRIKVEIGHLALATGVGWGLLGGLAATLVMDILLIGFLVAAGLPALACFSIVGATVSIFFPAGGTAGNIPQGIAAHYLIGPALGGLFGAAVSKIGWLRIASVKKGMVIAVLYAEILSQPLLAMPPVLLRMTVSDTLQWFVGSFVMHLIWGCVLGVLCGWALRLPSAEISE